MFQDKKRRTYSGMVTAMDEAIGNITRALHETGQDNNTLIVFTSDNGGQTQKGGNNYPLRGNKNTLWEGGTRAVSFIHGPMLQTPGSVNTGLLHVTDWLPTLVSAAGGQPGSLLDDDVDGVDQWNMLVTGSGDSKRRVMLYNIDPLKLEQDDNGNNAAIREGHYKLLVGDPGSPSGWIPPPQYDQNINISTVDMFDEKTVLLFDLHKDPCETTDLSKKYPNIVTKLMRRLK